MEYFAGLDVSMEETHVCVVDRDGKVILEIRTPTAPKTIAAALAKGPAVERVLFETGRMAPTLFHGLTALGMPVVCVETRHASLAKFLEDVAFACGNPAGQCNSQHGVKTR